MKGLMGRVEQETKVRNKRFNGKIRKGKMSGMKGSMGRLQNEKGMERKF